MKQPDNPKLGTAYKLVGEHHAFSVGDTLYLIHDDKSKCPAFSKDPSTEFSLDPTDPDFCKYSFVYWYKLEPLDYPPLKEAKYKIRVTPEQSRQIQEICFKAGIGWMFGGKEVKDFADNEWLEINYEEKCLTHSDKFPHHDQSWGTEISAQDFIRIYGAKKAKRAFEIGDLVKIVGNNSWLHHHKIGEIGIVTAINDFSPGALHVKVGKLSQEVNCKDLELITPVEEKEPEIGGLSRSTYTTCASGGTLTLDSMRDAYQHLVHEPMKPVYVGWDFGFNTTGKQPRKGLMQHLRKLTKFIKASVDSSIHPMYQLQYVEIDEDELVLTEEGREAGQNFMVLEWDGKASLKEAFGKYCAKQVAEIKKARKESEED